MDQRPREYFQILTSNAETGKTKARGKRRILILSAYHSHSHAYWSDLIEKHLVPDDNVKLLSLPARFFAWRQLGSALCFLEEHASTAFQESWDTIVSTSTCDLCHLRGLFPKLAETRNLVYFHENHFAYPSRRDSSETVSLQMATIYAALSADSVAFNSEFNRRSFLEGSQKLLKKMPDFRPASWVNSIAEKSRVLPVPIRMPALAFPSEDKDELRVLWNHRWEYDKGLELLKLTVFGCMRENLPIRFHLCGPRFASIPAEMQELLLKASTMIDSSDYQSSQLDYDELINKCDVVLSTTQHEFQGLSVMEGVLRGLFPLLPDRLVYPEIYPRECLYGHPGMSVEQESREIVSRLKALCGVKIKPWNPQLLRGYQVESLRGAYEEWFFKPECKPKA